MSDLILPGERNMCKLPECVCAPLHTKHIHEYNTHTHMHECSFDGTQHTHTHRVLYNSRRRPHARPGERRFTTRSFRWQPIRPAERPESGRPRIVYMRRRTSHPSKAAAAAAVARLGMWRAGCIRKLQDWGYTHIYAHITVHCTYM